MVALLVFAVVRGAAGYGDMFLHRADQSWQQWLHVSKYPPSLTYTRLELGLLCLILATLMVFEERIGFRKNGPRLVFGQTAMFFYLVHRLVMEIPATYFGLRGAGDLTTTYAVAIVLITLLYPLCRWYREVKASHPGRSRVHLRTFGYSLLGCELCVAVLAVAADFRSVLGLV